MKNQTILTATSESQWLARMSDLYERGEERPNQALQHNDHSCHEL